MDEAEMRYDLHRETRDAEAGAGAEKQEAARARWVHQSARSSWSRDRILTAD